MEYKCDNCERLVPADEIDSFDFGMYCDQCTYGGKAAEEQLAKEVWTLIESVSPLDK